MPVAPSMVMHCAGGLTAISYRPHVSRSADHADVCCAAAGNLGTLNEFFLSGAGINTIIFYAPQLFLSLGVRCSLLFPQSHARAESRGHGASLAAQARVTHHLTTLLMPHRAASRML